MALRLRAGNGLRRCRSGAPWKSICAARCRRQLELHYQPIVNLASSGISAFEALIRWRHPHKGLIAPSAFIPLAEELGLIVPIGKWVIRQACTTAATWPSDVKVTVNLSPAQVRNPGTGAGGRGRARGIGPAGRSPGAGDHGKHPAAGQRADAQHTLPTARAGRHDRHGRFWHRLFVTQLPPELSLDRIKIDRSFVKDIGDSVGSINIVRAVVAMAKGLGMATTAEGVETQEQRKSVQSKAATEMQGSLFREDRSLPMR